jgi:phosphoribosyl 1,2-cyclic phosphodiesterase
MNIKFWGVRGSIPTPLTSEKIENKIRRVLSIARPGDVTSSEAVEAFISSLPLSAKSTYGGNTSTIQLISDNGDQYILDCGSGLKNLGMELMGTEFGKGLGRASIFMSHTHWDHINGLPFFVPIYVEGNLFEFYSPYRDLRARFEHQQVPTHFPISLDYMPSTKEFIEIDPTQILVLNDMSIETIAMPHPGGSYGYRFEQNGRSFVYTSDCEFNHDSVDDINRFEKFFAGADVVVFDTQYTFEDSINKIDWGHSSVSIAIDIALNMRVKRLVLFHHDPDYDDDKLEKVLLNARSYLQMHTKGAGGIQIDLAYEGMFIEL